MPTSNPFIGGLSGVFKEFYSDYSDYFDLYIIHTDGVIADNSATISLGLYLESKKNLIITEIFKGEL